MNRIGCTGIHRTPMHPCAGKCSSLTGIHAVVRPCGWALTSYRCCRTSTDLWLVHTICICDLRFSTLECDARWSAVKKHAACLHFPTPHWIAIACHHTAAQCTTLVCSDINKVLVCNSAIKEKKCKIAAWYTGAHMAQLHAGADRL